MTLWDWSLVAWARRGVEQAALRRQDQAGDCVALLLWAAWAGPACEPARPRAADLAESFESEVLIPLRQARRALKRDRTGVEDLPDLHLRLRAVELAAERRLLEALGRLTPGAGRDAEAGFQRLDRDLGL